MQDTNKLIDLEKTLEYFIAFEKMLTDWDCRGEKIPERMAAGIARYVIYGISPGHFMNKVLSNDLMGASNHADQQNRKLLDVYVCLMHNILPFNCWGSEELVYEWSKRGGLDGLNGVEEWMDNFSRREI
jgi:hypothetical protein